MANTGIDDQIWKGLRGYEMSIKGWMTMVVVATLAGCAGSGSAGRKTCMKQLEAMTDTPDAIVQLRRAGCSPGTCPVYSVSVFLDGTVVYEGRSNVAVVGQQRAKLPADRVGELIVAMQETHFLDNPDNCCSCPGADKSNIVMIDYRPGHVEKTIVHDQACETAPLAMNTLTSTIERLTAVERWTTATLRPVAPPHLPPPGPSATTMSASEMADTSERTP
jgi:hypothetical protein